MRGLRHLKLLCFILILLSSQSCQRANSARETSSVAIPENTHAEMVKRDGMVLIKGGTFQMGTDDGMPYEAPVHEVVVNSFWIDEHEVTVAELGKFVEATGYKTDAERFGWSGVFNPKTGEWEKTAHADWRHPDGPREGRERRWMQGSRARRECTAGRLRSL